MSDTTLPPEQRSYPKVRIDRSRPFSEVHGTRGPGDPHQYTHFYQDGLPYDAQGFLVLDHVELQGDSPEAVKKRQIAEKKMKRQFAQQPKKGDVQEEGGAALVDGDDEGDGDDEPVEVNLGEWLAGRQNVEWIEVSNTIAHRYKRRVANVADAVVFLVEEKVLPVDQVAKKYQKHL